MIIVLFSIMRSLTYGDWMQKIAIAILLFACAWPCYALLSPLNQSIEEIQTILQDPHMQKYFSQSHPLLEICRIHNEAEEVNKTQKGYLLLTDQLELRVEIIDTPSKEHLPGRQQFKVLFHEPMNLSS